jgi:uncharacterized protein YijF (DUF1287 family)
MALRRFAFFSCCLLLVVFSPARAGGGRQGKATSPRRELSPTIQKVINAAKEQTGYTLYYDPAYVRLDYPGGDVPHERGVCTDVLIRAFRQGANIDLQKTVHEDMKRNFAAYPQKWGLSKPDPNIDHRRVPNLMAFFTRRGKALPHSRDARDYRPGDIVAWDLGNRALHIGLVSDVWSAPTGRYQIVHNIGAGARLEDRLFDWRIIGHYRYFD